MTIVQLTSSTFFGGPERQMLGLAQHLSKHIRTIFLSFREGGRCRAFLDEVRKHQIEAHELTFDTPHLRAAARELTNNISQAEILFCHGYKANLLGRVAARRAGLPAVAVSRGWTGENIRIRMYERLDRWHLKRMDHVIAVSDGQAEKVRRAGVPPEKITVIRNAARLSAFTQPDPAAREELLQMCPQRWPHLVLAAGRLSPEKGFDVLVEAATQIPDAGFILFGEGGERAKLESKIHAHNLQDRFVMPGLTDRLDRYLPWADVVTLPSHTEGLPNVALEASAAGVAVVATAVGGTPEVVADGESGFLVPSGNAAALAGKINVLLNNDNLRRRFGLAGHRRMQSQFTFEAQARQYLRFIETIKPQARLAA